MEPQEKATYSRKSRAFAWFKKLLEAGERGTYGRGQFTIGEYFLGHHTCKCGANSTGYDILLPNRTATNSLAFHYIAYHTDEVPPSEWKKLDELKRFVSFTVSSVPDALDT